MMAILPNKLKLHKELITSFSFLSKNFRNLFIFSFIINALILCPTWYMLQIYGRVITSRSHSTLIMLTILIVGVYFILEVMTYFRSRFMYSFAREVDKGLRAKIFDTTFQAKLKQQNFFSIQCFSDLKFIQDTLVSPVFLALLDAPIAVVTIVIIFLYDPFLGWLSVAGIIALIYLVFFNISRVQPVLSEANAGYIANQKFLIESLKNAETMKSMGIFRGIKKKWLAKNSKSSTLQYLANNRSASSIALSKMIQMMQGSLTLGMGIWLVMSGMLVAGTAEIIVNSMLATRAIAPLILLASSIQVIINGRDALKRLNNLLQFYKEPQETMKLPPPKGQLVVENLSVNDPITNENILRAINFQMQAGQTLAILGPSASGKSSLARLLVGVWPPYSGSVRLDGVNIYIWNKEELGSQIGYLPQEIELFEGTIAENIARFGKLDNLAIENAAKLVGIHDFICSLEMGYDHLVSDNGANFSGGQRQRIGLARAFYGLPKYIVLDEPNAHLDEQSELDLLNAIDYMKSKGSSVIVITHKVKIISKLDLILIMAHGMVKTFGKSDEILSKINATTLPIKN